MSHFLNNVSFWKDRRDGMVTAPRSVRVHASLMNLDSIGELRRWDLASNGTDERIVFRKLELPPMFMQKLATFPNIREMTFDGVPLPFEFYRFLFFFPHLRELSVINCTLPRRPVLSPFQIIDAGPANQGINIMSPFSFENLPITNLRLTDNRWYINRSTMFSAIGSLAVSGDLDYYNILHLATANNLRKLHINWNTQTANFFSPLAKGRTLCLTTRTKFDWLRLPHLTRQRKRRMYTSKLDHFLKACRRTMRTLEVEGYLYPFRKPRERVRIRKLEVYEGPLDFLRSVWNIGVDLKKIRIVEHVSDRAQIMMTLRSKELALAEERGRKYDSVKELELKVFNWEDRIMQDVLSMFGQLRVLKIEVVRGFPDEVHLTTKCQNLSLPGTASYLIPPATVWRRADAVDTWCQRFIDIDGNLVGNYANSAATGKNSGGDDVAESEPQPSIDHLENIIPDAVLVNTLDTLDESGQRTDNTRFDLVTMVIETIGGSSQNDEGTGGEGEMMSGIFGGTNSI
ncbi:hypothetical protein EV368DRAFT_69598 [Lentinula lateritia]|nr:hypothetical protein EV368DRAFT_69598 [Lentinula lateritia]